MEVIFLRIAIQKGLEELRSQLEDRGFEVVGIGESEVVDAVLYEELDSHPYYEVNNVSSPVASSSDGNSAYGALLVNTTNKSIEEITGILKRRTYSPLF